MKVVIIGGVAGGATAAARLRRLDESANIVVFERGGYVSYANCGLPYYIGGVITDRKKLTLQTPQSFFSRFNVDVRVHSEVIEIDRAAKRVRVRKTQEGDEYWESYDKLVYAPGAAAIRPAFVGEGDRIFTLRTMEDTFRLDDFLRDKRPARALVIGGGFIGLEAAENLAEPRAYGRPGHAPLRLRHGLHPARAAARQGHRPAPAQQGGRPRAGG